MPQGQFGPCGVYSLLRGEGDAVIDSVIFDCDGTLLDSMPAWHALQERFAQKAGIALNPMQLVRLNANTLPETAAFFHRECGLGSSVEEVLDDAHQILLSEYRDNVLARNGAVELARRLSGDGVKLAVASSSPVDFLQAGLERAGIFDLFDVVASAEGEGRTKSDPPVQRKRRFQAWRKSRQQLVC